MANPPTNDLFPLRVEALDQVMLAQDARRSPMAYPQVAEFQGEVQLPALREAMREALLRHPLLTARLGEDRRGRSAWVIGSDPLPVEIDVESGADLKIAPCQSRLRLNQEGGVRLYVRGGQESSQLTFLFHHAYTDGIGSYRFMGDVLALYAQRTSSTGDSASLVPLEPNRLTTRRDSMAYGPERNARRYGWENLAGDLVRRVFGQAAEPLAGTRVSIPNRSYAPFPGILTHTLDPNQFHAFRKAAERQAVYPNDLLLAASFQTLVTWNARRERRTERPFRIAVPVDLRAKGDELMPAANCVSMAYLQRTAEQCADGRQLVDSLRVDTLRMRSEVSGTDYIQLLMQLSAVPGLIRVFVKGAECPVSAIVSNTGDPTRRFTTTLPRVQGKLVCGNLVLQNIYGISPLLRHVRVAVAAQSYNRGLTLSLRTDPYRLTLRDSREILKVLVDHLGELISRS